MPSTSSASNGDCCCATSNRPVSRISTVGWPTIWCDGRVVGGWAHRWNGEGTAGEVATRLLEDVGAERTALVAAEAERLTQRLCSWLPDAVVVPRFRTPVERELSAVGGHPASPGDRAM